MPDEKAPSSGAFLPSSLMHHLSGEPMYDLSGVDNRPIAFRSPWQNAYVERLIGSIRRECLDHMIVFGEAHLCRILGAYAAYYNELRTHLSLNKDTPLHRAIQRIGAITSQPVLGGLHHQYCRI